MDTGAEIVGDTVLMPTLIESVNLRFDYPDND
jgi:hypothetical protein